MRQNLNILVVDDEAFVNEQIQYQIRSLGYRVAGSAYDGPEAVRLAEQLHPDLVLMDLRMMDPVTGRDDMTAGLSAAREIGDRWPVPVVLLTAYENDELLRLSCASGISGYLLKPVSDSDLARTIEIARSRFEDMMSLYARNTRLLLEKERLDTELLQKTVRIREIHHRVKNNFQAVASVLHLHSMGIKAPECSNLLDDAQSRLLSLALLHELLHEAPDDEDVPSARLCRRICVILQEVYRTDSVKIRVDADEKLTLPSRLGLPYALILNELLSNALKHAFPDGTSGTINVSFGWSDGYYRLRVSDDGVGLPEGYDPEHSESLGLRLVMLLAEHDLSGRLEVDRNGGTTFTVVFPADA